MSLSLSCLRSYRKGDQLAGACGCSWMKTLTKTQSLPWSRLFVQNIIIIVVVFGWHTVRDVGFIVIFIRILCCCCQLGCFIIGGIVWSNLVVVVRGSWLCSIHFVCSDFVIFISNFVLLVITGENGIFVRRGSWNWLCFWLVDTYCHFGWSLYGLGDRRSQFEHITGNRNKILIVVVIIGASVVFIIVVLVFVGVLR